MRCLSRICHTHLFHRRIFSTFSYGAPFQNKCQWFHLLTLIYFSGQAMKAKMSVLPAKQCPYHDYWYYFLFTYFIIYWHWCFLLPTYRLSLHVDIGQAIFSPANVPALRPAPTIPFQNSTTDIFWGLSIKKSFLLPGIAIAMHGVMQHLNAELLQGFAW